MGLGGSCRLGVAVVTSITSAQGVVASRVSRDDALFAAVPQAASNFGVPAPSNTRRRRRKDSPVPVLIMASTARPFILRGVTFARYGGVSAARVFGCVST